MRIVHLEQQAIIPSKVVCVGRNFVEHIHELNNEVPTAPVIFIKPNSALSDSLSTKSQPLHYETEIVFLIQNQALYAVGVGLDLTDRALQTELKNKGLPWERAKAFDGSAVMSHFLPLADMDIHRLHFVMKINGEIRQQGGSPEMITQPQALLDFVQQDFTLEDGDLLMTGTPKGVGTYQRGDVVDVTLYHAETPLLRVQWCAN